MAEVTKAQVDEWSSRSISLRNSLLIHAHPNPQFPIFLVTRPFVPSLAANLDHDWVANANASWHACLPFRFSFSFLRCAASTFVLDSSFEALAIPRCLEHSFHSIFDIRHVSDICSSGFILGYGWPIGSTYSKSIDAVVVVCIYCRNHDCWTSSILRIERPVRHQ